MLMKNLSLLAIALVALTISGCQIFGPDEVDGAESTYPAALDLPAASF